MLELGLLDKVRALPSPERAKLNVVSYVYRRVKVTEKGSATPIYGVYAARFAEGNPLVFIKMPNGEEIGLGEQVLYLKKLGAGTGAAANLGWTPDEITAFQKAGRNDPHLKFQVQKFADEIKAEHDRTIAANDLEDSLVFYTPVTPYGVEITGFSDEELSECLELSLTRGWKYHPDVLAWAKQNLICLPVAEENLSLMRGIGHALIIKPTSAGFTTLSQRITELCPGALHIDANSLKTFEGFASADGQITHGTLHMRGGSLTLDEFRRMDDEQLLPRICGAMQSGRLDSAKAGKLIRNMTLARFNFIANPDEKPAMQDETLNAYGFDDAQLCLELIERLTPAGSAAFARFGFIFYIPSRKRDEYACRKAEDCPELPVEDYSKLDALAVTLLTGIAAKLLELFRLMQPWTDAEIPDYARQIDLVIKEGKAEPRLALLWGGAKQSYRHARGAALERALIALAPRILRENDVSALIPEVIEAADEQLRALCATNLESLRGILQVTATSESPELFALRLKNLSPDYLKPVLLCASIMGERGANSFKLEDLGTVWASMPMELRDAYSGSPKYRYWGNLHQNLKSRAAREKMKTVLLEFGLETLEFDGGFEFKAKNITMKMVFEKSVNWVNQVNYDVNTTHLTLTQFTKNSPNSLTSPGSPPPPSLLGDSTTIPNEPKSVVQEGSRVLPGPKIRKLHFKPEGGWEEVPESGLGATP
jgi:hypothetical protein